MLVEQRVHQRRSRPSTTLSQYRSILSPIVQWPAASAAAHTRMNSAGRSVLRAPSHAPRLRHLGCRIAPAKWKIGLARPVGYGNKVLSPIPACLEAELRVFTNCVLVLGLYAESTLLRPAREVSMLRPICGLDDWG
jgi:hypothetical protein